MINAFQYVINNGILPAAKYPYKGIDTFPCAFNPVLAVANLSIAGFQLLPAGNETMMQIVVANIGPVSCAIDASLATFQSYSSGIYSDPQCSTDRLNHAMLIVGYGTDNSTTPAVDYWIVKNSYGKLWGERG